jgi:hypothetical protein
MASYTIVKPGRLDLQAVRIELLNRGPESFEQDLREIVTAMQADREDALAQARELLLAAQLLLQEEGARLEQLAPGPGELRVAALRQAALQTLRQADELQQWRVAAAIRPPTLARGEVLVHGRVTDDQARGTGLVTVALADGKGRLVPEVPPARAGANRYYARGVPAAVAAQLPAEAKLGVVVSHGEQKVQPRLEPLSLGGGGVKVADVRLDAAALERLKLRVPVVAPAPASPARPGAVRRQRKTR